jgi:DNA-directed RNA polymerase specialized sigma24 family protein
VFDRNAASTVLAIAELSKKELYDKLLEYALWRTSSTADAEDLLADAIECVGESASTSGTSASSEVAGR